MELIFPKVKGEEAVHQVKSTHWPVEGSNRPISVCRNKAFSVDHHQYEWIVLMWVHWCSWKTHHKSKLSLGLFQKSLLRPGCFIIYLASATSSMSCLIHTVRRKWPGPQKHIKSEIAHNLHVLSPFVFNLFYSTGVASESWSFISILHLF